MVETGGSKKPKRAAAKAASRTRDEARLAAGQVSPEELRRENFAFAGADLKRARIIGRHRSLAKSKS